MFTEKSKFDVSQRMFIMLIIGLVGLLAFWGFKMYDIYNASTGNYSREITVDAEGKSYVTPDVAMLNLGVHTKSTTAAKAVEENTVQMNKIIEELTKAGVDKKDIQTASYYLNPDYKWTDKDGNTPDGYVLDQSVTVKIRDFTKIGAIMASATTAGANTIGNLQFTIDDREKAKEKAREEAITKAKEKAEKIAAQTGLKLSRVVNYYEYEDYYEGATYNGPYTGMAEGGGGGMPAPEVQSGQQEVSLKVTLTYKLR
ncbi:MAG: SIMPL domain-containing protein [Candidatus Gracilibacteria bacterium]